MDFSKTNIISVLEGAILNRFQDFPPSDLEDFICQLFKESGYDVKQTSYSGDYGADLILTKGDEKIAVQVKRYSKGNNVGVKDINQVLGGKDYYNCKSARVITTSSFTKAGKNLASQTQTELWDWARFQKVICDTYLEGKDYYEYFKASVVMNAEDRKFDFEVTKVEYEKLMKKIGSCTLVYTNMKNLTNRNINLSLLFPVFISQHNRQIEASYWYEGYFSGGAVYAGCTVELSFIFRSEQLPRVRNDDRIIFRWTEDDYDVITQECRLSRDYVHPFDLSIQKGNVSSTEKCFIVTMCYGRDSRECRQMIHFRDSFLNNFRLGSLIVESYYRYGPGFAQRLQRYYVAKTISRFFVRMALLLVMMCNYALLKTDGK